MAEDLSLLFRLRADNQQAKAALAETKTAVNQLRQSFGPELTQTFSLANKAFSGISDNLNVFVGQRIPLVGGAFVRVTENLRNFTSEGSKTETALAGIAKSVQSVATQSNRTVPEITNFLTKFAQLGTQAERDKSAIEFFGASLGARLIPELEETSTAMAAVAGESAAAGGAIAGLALPVGIAIAAVAALVGGLALVTKELFETSKAAAAFQGEMQDLSQQTGVTVETLSALEVLAKTTGGSITTITQALVQFQRKLDDSLDPLSKTAAEFRDLGIGTTDTESALRQAFAALARMPEGFRQTNAAAELFSARGGKQVLAILKETSGDLDGAIQRFRDLGILIEGDDARAADKFNDELALLDFQLRSLKAVIGKDLIPILIDLIRNFAELVRASRPFLEVIGAIAKVPFKVIADDLRLLAIAAKALSGDFAGAAQAIRDFDKAREELGTALTTPITTQGPQPTALPGQRSTQQQTAEAARLANDLVAITKRRVANESEALNQLFEKGRKDREQQARETVELNRQVLKADTDRIDAELAQQEQLFKNIAREKLSRQEIVDAEQAIQQKVSQLQQDRLDKEAEFERTASALRAKARKERADSERNEAANTTDRLVAEFENQIKQVQAAIDRNGTPEAEGLAQIEQLERAKIEARIEGLEQQKRIGFLTVEEQKDLDRQLQQAQQEADHLEEDQQRRRLARAQATSERLRDIKLAEIDSLLQAEQIAGERQIAAIESLAEQRIIAEEEAAKSILAIRLSLIDDEIQATKTKLQAAASITGVDERERVEADLNNQLRILAEQRLTILADGNRDIDEGRRKDLDNARRYADELKKIDQRIRDAQRDAAEQVIRLMIIHSARRKDIIRVRLQADLDAENVRHEQALETIRNLESENRQSSKTAEEKLEEEKQLNQLREAELDRHLKTEAEIRAAAKKAQRDVEGVFVPGDLLPDIEAGAGIVESVTEGLRAAFKELKNIGLDAFSSLAQGIGSLVQNYVLLGTTGPAALRKLLAATLAQIAAESAVKAIYWTAQGIVDLFFNPARAAADFTAAALFASLAGVSALAGRAIAGDLFKPQGGTSASRDGSQSGPLQTIVQGRNQPPQVQTVRLIFEHRVSDSEFGRAINTHIVRNVGDGGELREVFISDGRSG